jgi:hypothetical protein
MLAMLVSGGLVVVAIIPKNVTRTLIRKTGNPPLRLLRVES